MTMAAVPIRTMDMSAMAPVFPMRTTTASATSTRCWAATFQRLVTTTQRPRKMTTAARLIATGVPTSERPTTTAEALLDDGGCLFGGCTDDRRPRTTMLRLTSTTDLACSKGVPTHRLATLLQVANFDDGSCDLTLLRRLYQHLACNYDAQPRSMMGRVSSSAAGVVPSGAFNYDDTASLTTGLASLEDVRMNRPATTTLPPTLAMAHVSIPGCTDASGLQL